MKILKTFIFALAVCLSLTGCIKEAGFAGASDTKDYNKLFEFNLYSDKQVYKTTDKINLWATLKYVGDKKQIKIWHNNPCIGFSIIDGNKFKPGCIYDDILTSTILIKDKLYKFDYVKSGAYSEDDPDADFWRKFLNEKDLYLPSGEYTIQAGSALDMDENGTESSNLLREIKIKVEN